MQGYKEPGFHERTASAKRAKDKALLDLKNKPRISEAEQARRLARQEAKEAAAVAKREAAKAAAETARLEREAAAAAVPAPPTEAERKAARDARYAARKKRKS